MLPLSVLYFTLWNKKSNEELFATYYEPYPNVAFPQKGSGEIANQFRLAKEKYDARDYRLTYEYLANMLSLEPDNRAIQFYMGVALIADNKAAKAIDPLLQVIEDKSSEFKEPAEWYLGLALLKTNQKDKTQYVLRIISSREGSYRDKAKELLEEM